jgi:DNA-binding MarR family transcriptional regulator
MNALFVHGGTMIPSHISKWIFRAKHSVTSMLQVLENIGYLKRKTSDHDCRSINISITNKGRRATNKMMPIAEEISEGILSCLDKGQIDNIKQILKKSESICSLAWH